MASYITVMLKIDDIALSSKQVKEHVNMSRTFHYEVGNDMYIVTHNKSDVKDVFKNQYDEMRAFFKSLAPSIIGNSRVIGSINDSSEIPYKTIYYHCGLILVESQSVGEGVTVYDLDDVVNECVYSLGVRCNEELSKESIATYIEYIIEHSDFKKYLVE